MSNKKAFKFVWKVVTCASELYVGQQVRYKTLYKRFGYIEDGDDSYRGVISIMNGIVDVGDSRKKVTWDNLFCEAILQVEALFKIEEKGEWRVVTSFDQVYVGQTVRYHGARYFGYGDEKDVSCRFRIIRCIKDGEVKTCDECGNITSHNIFSGVYKVVEAFFPDNEVKKEKVARIKLHMDSLGFWSFDTLGISSRIYKSKNNAIHGAKRFCKKIGFECKIIS